MRLLGFRRRTAKRPSAFGEPAAGGPHQGVVDLPDLAVLVEPMLRRTLRERIVILHRRLLAVVRNDEVRRWMTFGVGPRGGVDLSLPRRPVRSLPKSKSVGAVLGLTCGKYQLGEVDRNAEYHAALVPISEEKHEPPSDIDTGGVALVPTAFRTPRPKQHVNRGAPGRLRSEGQCLSCSMIKIALKNDEQAALAVANRGNPHPTTLRFALAQQAAVICGPADRRRAAGVNCGSLR